MAAPKNPLLLRELERGKHDFTPAALDRTVELLEALESCRLTSAKQVLALHELLIFLRAFPGDARVLAVVERMLACFDSRADLRRHRRELEDTAIAGTALHFPFYWLSARWLVQRWPEALTVNWSEFEGGKKLVDLLYLLLPFSECATLDNAGLPARKLVEALRGADETDAAFLLRRFEALDLATPVREQLYEGLEMPLELSPGATTPARGRERWEGASVVFPREPWPSARPDLKRAVRRRSFTVRDLDPEEGARLIELANTCMVNRLRDLYVFLNADPNDVRLIDFGDGLQFACMGAVPQQRIVLESVYGFLTLMNGVPAGYVLCSALMGSSEIAYNVFETFRGVGAGHVYGRVLEMVHGLFGSDCFAVDPYQLGHKNAEGQRSGAWWFYYKLGFRPDDPRVRELVAQELARIAAEPGYRTSRSRLNRMAAKYMFWHLGRKRRDVLGRLDLGRIGLHVSRNLAALSGSGREEGVATCQREGARLLGLGSTRSWSAGERLAWERWAPLVQVLPGVAGWTAKQKRDLVQVIRAKGGPRESEYVRLFDGHTKLRAAFVRLAASQVPGPVGDGL